MSTSTDDTPAISVIVCSLTPPEQIDCLRVLDAQQFDDYEVIYRDDPGLAAARNAGIEAATADRLVFLDDDAVPHANYLPAMIDALDANPIVAGRIVHPGDGVISEFTGSYDQGNHRHYVRAVPTSFRRGSTGLTGCNMAFRGGVFNEIGGFDERFEWGHEETDLIRRAVEADYRVLYDPDAAVTHWYATSIRDYWRKMANFGTADLRYDRKWETPLSERLVESLIPVRLGPTPAAAAVATVGNTLRNIEYLKTWLSE
ncbi:Glycosyl transferase family 2 [Halapricum desulfuricans]|uniref:Glycosyl transferase family 2 n=1 Tax=Halapricum desulfuricans TaxID=2841257 RepID=A0A897NF84_9EURY|nr:glycosyltransferase [Halapricum desulfuricans]QSG11357.1 Glycosyl transferase family 2 [Halapricum desulfuricans]